MASAAERLFATFDILEQILIDCELNTKELFSLQCVSRSFSNAINGSKPLLRTMEILHKGIEGSRTEKKYRIPNSFLEHEQLELYPFRYRTEVLAPASPKNGGTEWKMNIHFWTSQDLAHLLTKAPSEFCLKPTKHFNVALDGSWRRMKAARLPVVIDVLMRVHYMDVSYQERVSDSTGQMTLGNVVALLEAVRDRSEAEHRERAAAMPETSQDGNGEASQTHGCRVS